MNYLLNVHYYLQFTHTKRRIEICLKLNTSFWRFVKALNVHLKLFSRKTHTLCLFARLYISSKWFRMDFANICYTDALKVARCRQFWIVPDRISIFLAERTTITLSTAPHVTKCTSPSAGMKQRSAGWKTFENQSLLEQETGSLVKYLPMFRRSFLPLSSWSIHIPDGRDVT